MRKIEKRKVERSEIVEIFKTMNERGMFSRIEEFIIGRNPSEFSKLLEMYGHKDCIPANTDEVNRWIDSEFMNYVHSVLLNDECSQIENIMI